MTTFKNISDSEYMCDKISYLRSYFNNFSALLQPLDSRGYTYVHFCLQVHVKVSAAWYYSHCLPPVSLTPVANLPPVSLIPVAICHRCCWAGGKFAAGVVDPGGRFATGVVDAGVNFAANVVDTGGKFATGVADTGGQPWAANISANFRKN